MKFVFGTRKAERDQLLVAIRGRPGLRDVPTLEQSADQAEGKEGIGLDGTWSESFTAGDTLLCASSDGELLFTAGGSPALRTWDASGSCKNLCAIETRVGK